MAGGTLGPAPGPAMTAVMRERPSVHIRVLEEVGHLAPLQAPQLLADEMLRFLCPEIAQRVPESAPRALEKADIAASFSRAASSYDSVAHVQRDVGKQLLLALDRLRVAPYRVLDLGCGTGFFRSALQRRFPAAHYIGLDLAPGMVRYARARCGAGCAWLVGDAEALPLANQSVDIVFSSLALQWCDRPELLFAELARVLAPGGVCVFTSLGPQTLCELRAAWAAADDFQHVNTFLPTAVLRAAAAKVPGVHLVMEQRAFAADYSQVRDLLDELKALGAHNMNRHRPVGLASRQALHAMLRAYEARRSAGRLPATYDVIFGTLETA